jgi:hypothetical protein
MLCSNICCGIDFLSLSIIFSTTNFVTVYYCCLQLVFGNLGMKILYGTKTLKDGNGEQLRYGDIPYFMEEKHLKHLSHLSKMEVVKSLLFTFSAPTLPYIILKQYISNIP